MNRSKYLESIQRAKNHFTLTGDCLLVEQIPVEKEKKTASGLFVPTSISGLTGTLDKDAPVFVHILAVGAGFYDENGNDIPNSVSPGDIVLVGPTSTRWFSLFEIDHYQAYEIGITRESEIHLIYKGLEGYNAAIKAINNQT